MITRRPLARSDRWAGLWRRENTRRLRGGERGAVRRAVWWAGGAPRIRNDAGGAGGGAHGGEGTRGGKEQRGAGGRAQRRGAPRGQCDCDGGGRAWLGGGGAVRKGVKRFVRGLRALWGPGSNGSVSVGVRHQCRPPFCLSRSTPRAGASRPATARAATRAQWPPRSSTAARPVQGGCAGEQGESRDGRGGFGGGRRDRRRRGRRACGRRAGRRRRHRRTRHRHGRGRGTLGRRRRRRGQEDAGARRGGRRARGRPPPRLARRLARQPLAGVRQADGGGRGGALAHLAAGASRAGEAGRGEERFGTPASAPLARPARSTTPSSRTRLCGAPRGARPARAATRGGAPR